MTPWEKVVAATEGHNIDSIRVRLDSEAPTSWTYIGCTCDHDAFEEGWEFTDHIRRLVFDAIKAEE